MIVLFSLYIEIDDMEEAYRQWEEAYKLKEQERLLNKHASHLLEWSTTGTGDGRIR
jgi:hypothetical protein